ncbi:hypothetical protein K1719_000761 [Acacia pycnantha]|nr:hypothetical protein K1719_000761 [Acacia pycnantha]
MEEEDDDTSSPCPTFPDCGFKQPNSGVVLSYLDCFLRNGSCLLRNNCEDFALYCKTGLLIVDKQGVGRSGQASVIGALLAAVLSSPLKLLMLSPVGVATVTAGMYVMSRYATDIGVRSDVIKVAVEDLAVNLEWTNSNNEEVLLPKLEKLELSFLNRLIPSIWDDQLLHNSFNNLKILTVESCGFVKLVPLHVLKSLNKLEELEVEHCDMLEIVFDFEDLNDYSKEMVASSILVPLKKLELRNLPKLKNVWNNNCQGNVSFPSLRSVDVSYCKSLTSIFPASIAKSMLGDLEELQIANCSIDVIIAKGQVSESVVVIFGFPRLTSLRLSDLPNLRNFYPQKHTLEWPHLNQLSIQCCGELEISENEVSRSSEIYEEESTLNSTYPLFSQDKVLLPKLEILKLSKLNSLIPSIWDDHLLQNSFNNLKVLVVKSCGFVRLVPLHVLKSLNNLEELDVEDCDMLEIIFDFEDLNDYYKEMDSSSIVVQLKELKLWNLPKLKNVWSNNCQGNVSFPSLRNISVYKCESLTSIFPASIAKGMLCELERLAIRQCGVDVIVAKDQVSESVAVTFGFPRLTSLELSGLPNLRNFYPQKHTLEWPQLKRLYIQCCDELEIFEKEVSCSSKIYEEENMLDSKYYLLSHGKVIGNLEGLALQGKEVEKIGSGQFLMYHFPKLKQLHLSFEKKLSSLVWKSSPNLGELELNGNFKKALGGDNVAALTARFPKLTLRNISIMGSLSPSLVSSLNLTHLDVSLLYRWTTLMTSSIAKNLVHLTHLSVSYCSKMEEIITKQEGEDDGDKEIIFRKLEFLKFDHLQSLRRFCRHNYSFKFLLLDQLIIEECPKFKTFSPGLIETPSLKSVQLGKDWKKHHEIWNTDLNKTFYHQRYVTSSELVLDEDDAIMIRNDQFPADCCPQVEILRIKGFVDEWVTFPYTLLGRFPNPNALQVENSSFEEILPSHTPSFTSLHNLTELKVSECHQLVYLMTTSTTKSLVNLETLDIDHCEKLEEIVRNDINEDVEGGITFNGLRILKLNHLPRLKTQEDKRDFNIEDQATNIVKSLFSQKKVSLPKLERLELFYLLNNLVSLIWDDQLLHNSFNNLKTLILERCDFMKTVPLRVLKSLNNLEKLEVNFCHKLEMVFGFEDLNDYHKEMEMESSSSVVVPLNLTHLSISNCNRIEEIITNQEEDDEDNEILFKKLEFLELTYLPRLNRFCGYSYTFRFPLLEHVSITDCPHVTMFCPGAIHAPHLQSVRVGKYNSHKHIWMTDLNNTIQHLLTFEEVISTTERMVINAKNITRIVDVFPNVMWLDVESFMDEGVTFPYSFLEKFPKLFQLKVKHCSFEEIFPSQDQIIDLKGKIPPFRGLYIAYMDKLKSIWKDDSQLPPIHQNLVFLKVKSCCSLVKLAPSSASFQNLTELYVFRCHQLIHLVTTSTAKSLKSMSLNGRMKKTLTKQWKGYPHQRIALIHRRITSSSKLSSSGVGDDADT